MILPQCQEHREFNQDLFAATKEAVKRGQVSEIDVNVVRIELQQAQQRKQVLQIELQSRLMALNRLLGQPPTKDFTIAGELTYATPVDVDSFTLERALNRRPDYLAAEYRIKLTRAEQQLVQASRYDDWEFGVGYDRERTVVDGAPPQDRDEFLGLKLVVPLPLFDRKKGLILETQARERRASRSLEDLRLQVQPWPNLPQNRL